ncbi:MAG: hypothetical protein ACOX4L_08220 [Bacillota bacterium]
MSKKGKHKRQKKEGIYKQDYHHISKSGYSGEKGIQLLIDLIIILIFLECLCCNSGKKTNNIV